MGLGEEKKWYGTLPYTPEGKDTGHPVFKSISALSRGILEKKNGQDTTHFNADASNTELLFQIIHSVNQLSIYGAVTNWCEQFGLTEEEKGQAKLKESVTKDVFDMCEITRSKTFGISSKTSIWKQLARKHVQTQGISWEKIQNSTWRGRRFWAVDSVVPRIHAFSSTPTIQNFCSNSWRNKYWTSH